MTKYRKCFLSHEKNKKSSKKVIAFVLFFGGKELVSVQKTLALKNCVGRKKIQSQTVLQRGNIYREREKGKTGNF